MIQAQVDKKARVLKVHYTGQVDADQISRGADQVTKLVKGLPSGFRLLTDLTGLEKMDLNCVPHLKRMMDVCDEAGVELVVRVIPDPKKDIGLKILSLFHYRKRVRIVTCQSLAEALEALAR